MQISGTSIRAGMLALTLGLALPLFATTLQDAPQDAPKPAPGDRAPDATPPASTADLPKAKKVLDDAIKAMGGRKAFEDIESTMFKMSIASFMGAVVVEGHTTRDGRFLFVQEQQGSRARMGYDGKVGWVDIPMMGYSLISKEEANDRLKQFDFHGLILRMEESFETIEVIDRSEFEGKPCYKMLLKGEKDPNAEPDAEPADDDDADSDDGEQFFFFNVETGLPAGAESAQETPMGPMTITIRFEEWKEFGDLKLFTRMKINQMGQDVTFNWTELEFDTVDDAVFALPEEVKQLALERMMEDKPAEDAPTPEPGSGN